MLTLPALHGESMTLTITGIDARSTIDRRFGEPTILPVAITEIGGSGLAHTTAIPAGGSCRTDLVSVDGKPLGVTVSADDVKAMTAGAAVTVQPCDAAPLQLEPGSHLVVGANGLRSGIDVDRVVLSEGTPAPATAGPTVTVQRTRTTRTATVAACPGGCWLIFGEGYNSGWTATAAGRSLGAPRQIAGGFNGWWLAPSSTATTVAIAWKAQGSLNLALTASAIGVLLCLLVVWRGKLGKPATAPPPPQFEDRLVSRRPLRESIVVAGVLTVAAALAISWSFGVVGAALGIVVVVTRRTRLLGVAAAALAGALGLVVLWRETVHRYFVNAGWTSHFEDLHRYGLLVVVLLLASAFTRETLGEAPGEPPSDAVTSAGPR